MTIELNDDEAIFLNILLSKERVELTELIQKYKNIAFDSESELSARLFTRNVSHITYLKGQLSLADNLISKLN